MANLSITGVLSTIQIMFYTWRKGKLVGKDSFGNKYYEGKTKTGADHSIKQSKRWVIYKDKPDASKVPPEWHGWLHYQTNELPKRKNPHRQTWQQKHQPNQTGTDEAYHPLDGKKKRANVTGDYQAWKPSNKTNA